MGAGSTGPYYVTFPVYAQANVVVISTVDATGVETILQNNVDYTWTSFVADNLGQVTAGQITLTDVLASGYTLSILSVPPGTQLTDIKNQAAFFPVIHEIEMDLLAQKDLQQQEQLDKALVAPDSEPSGTCDLTLPAATIRASMILGFDSDGDVEMLDPNDLDVSPLWTVDTSLVANGATQGTATLLTAAMNVVAINSAIAVAAKLPVAEAGMEVTVRFNLNSGSGSARLYPNTGAQIDALGANAHLSLPSPDISGTITLKAVSGTQWYTINNFAD